MRKGFTRKEITCYFWNMSKLIWHVNGLHREGKWWKLLAGEADVCDKKIFRQEFLCTAKTKCVLMFITCFLLYILQNAFEGIRSCWMQCASVNTENTNGSGKKSGIQLENTWNWSLWIVMENSVVVQILVCNADLFLWYTCISW